MVSHLSKGRDRRREEDREGVRARPGAPILRDWLSTLPKAKGARAAAFDTRIGKPMIVTGSAAKGIAKRLRHDGYELVTEPESFVVDGSEGPLHEGELERAREWGRSLAKAAG